MIFVGYGDRFGVKAYRLYDPTHRRFQLAHSVYFDETSLISPQHDNQTPNITSFTPPMNPSPSKPTTPTIHSNPQVEWEEPSQFLPLLPTPTPNPSSSIPTPPLNPSTSIPTPRSAPPWSLGNKTTSHLFPNSPTTQSTNESHPTPRACKNTIPTKPQRSNQPLPPTIPVESIYQPSLLGPIPKPRQPKTSKS